MAKWKNLKNLNLSTIVIYIGYNFIGDKGCQYLSKSNWDSLTHIRAKWNNLTKLILSILANHLDKNNICAEGCEYLSSDKWDNLTQLELGNTIIM